MVMGVVIREKLVGVVDHHYTIGLSQTIIQKGSGFCVIIVIVHLDSMGIVLTTQLLNRVGVYILFSTVDCSW
jgi:hypothetical protein